MKNIEPPPDQPETNAILIPRESKLDLILSQIDLIAIVVAVLGLFLLGMVALVEAVIHLADWISHLWSHSLDRWLIIILGVAILWVVVRWKKSCV